MQNKIYLQGPRFSHYVDGSMIQLQSFYLTSKKQFSQIKMALKQMVHFEENL